MKLIYAFATAFVVSVLSAEGKPYVNAAKMSVVVPNIRNEFVVADTLDKGARANGWIYLFRHIHHDPEREQSFGLTLSKEDDGYLLMLHESYTLKYSDWDKMSMEEKRRSAKVVAIVDEKVAQSLYEAYAIATIRARHGYDFSSSTEERYYYISCYGRETGFMSARAEDLEKDATTGIMGLIGLELREYLMQTDGLQKTHIMDRILKNCRRMAVLQWPR